MMKSRPHAAITALAAIAACFTLLPGVQAQQNQSVQEATALLTSGKWIFGGKQIKRTFHADGTFSSSNGSIGTWRIDGGELEIVFEDNTRHRFFLPVDPNGMRGVDNKGKPDTMVRISGGKDKTDAREAPAAAGPAPTPPVTADVQQKASALIQTYHDSLVFVTGAAGAGSGFVAAMEGGNFLVTNVHVAAGIRDAAFRTLDGTPVQGGAASMAIGEDIFCMALPAGGTPLQIMQEVDKNAAVGDDVVVLGNAEGQGVINTIIGKIVGIGPNLVEVDAPFVPGNSGSPIIHLKTGKVIGVATYLVTNEYDLATDQKLEKPIVRRFGYRIDSVKGWQPINWGAFNAQAAEMESVDALTADLYDFFRDINENKGVVTPGRHTNPIIKNRIDDWVAAKSGNPSAADSEEADANFISFLKIACQSDIAAAQRRISYDYFVRDLADQKQTRDGMAKAFQEIIQGIRQ